MYIRLSQIWFFSFFTKSKHHPLFRLLQVHCIQWKMTTSPFGGHTLLVVLLWIKLKLFSPLIPPRFLHEELRGIREEAQFRWLVMSKIDSFLIKQIVNKHWQSFARKDQTVERMNWLWFPATFEQLLFNTKWRFQWNVSGNDFNLDFNVFWTTRNFSVTRGSKLDSR